jgi:two-component system, cell cycle response regulator DivK
MSKILLIEDNAQNRYLVNYLLVHRGHVVLNAENGEDGVALAVSERPDLILLDIQLPGMDGYAVARLLRSHEALRLVPVLAVTSHAMVGDRETALRAGCSDYLEKPIDPDSFAGTVETYLGPPARPAP